ncbi:MAG: hypothetical protein AAF125_28370, partial [Chloroflexota bacterium]
MADTQVNLKHHDYLLETIRLQVQGDLFFTSWVSSEEDTPLLVALHSYDDVLPPPALITHLVAMSAYGGGTHN